MHEKTNSGNWLWCLNQVIWALSHLEFQLEENILNLYLHYNHNTLTY